MATARMTGNPRMTKTRIDLLRHGLPEGGHRYRGNGIDDPLSETGWRQMWAAVGDDWPWHGIVCSPMARCRPFAEDLGRRSGLPVVVDKRLREVGFGAWEGKSADEILTEDPEAVHRFYADPVAGRPEGAEPLGDFRHRVVEALREIMDDNPGRHLLVVAHAGVLRAAMSWLLDAPLERMYRSEIRNAAFLHIQSGGGRPPSMVLRGPDRE